MYYIPEVCLYYQLFKFKGLYKDTRLCNIFKTRNATKFIKTILTRTREKTRKIVSIGPPIPEKQPYQKSEILSFLVFYFEKELTFSIFCQ